jgi:hypothetical protein
VRFTQAIRDDPVRHESLCEDVGVIFRGGIPGWKHKPDTQTLPLQDLGEIGLSVHSAL